LPFKETLKIPTGEHFSPATARANERQSVRYPAAYDADTYANNCCSADNVDE
jgi:hypothetical protein